MQRVLICCDQAHDLGGKKSTKENNVDIGCAHMTVEGRPEYRLLGTYRPQLKLAATSHWMATTQASASITASQ